MTEQISEPGKVKCIKPQLDHVMDLIEELGKQAFTLKERYALKGITREEFYVTYASAFGFMMGGFFEEATEGDEEYFRNNVKSMLSFMQAGAKDYKEFIDRTEQ